MTEERGGGYCIVCVFFFFLFCFVVVQAPDTPGPFLFGHIVISFLQLWDSLAWRFIRMGRRREEKKWSPDDDEDAWVLLWWVEGDNDDDDGVSDGASSFAASFGRLLQPWLFDNDDDLTPATAREVDAGSWEVGMLQMGIMMIDRCEECVKNGNRNDSKQMCRLGM